MLNKPFVGWLEPFGRMSEMFELGEIQRLLSETAALLKTGTKADKRKAASKLQEIAAIATTLGFTIQLRH